MSPLISEQASIFKWTTFSINFKIHISASIIIRRAYNNHIDLFAVVFIDPINPRILKAHNFEASVDNDCMTLSNIRFIFLFLCVCWRNVSAFITTYNRSLGSDKNAIDDGYNQEKRKKEKKLKFYVLTTWNVLNCNATVRPNYKKTLWNRNV